MSLRRLSELLNEDLQKLPSASLTIGQILELFHERSFGFLLLLFAIPMALPIPVPPGINILLATPLFFLTFQQMIGLHKIWLPKFITAKKVNGGDFKSMMSKALPLIRQFEHLIKPRLAFMTHGFLSYLIGFCGVFFTLFIMIPVPMTNTAPSFAIALMAIGVIMRDGLAVIAGIIFGFSWIGLLTWAFITFGTEGFDIIKEWIKSLI
jgi:hypothetical protein